MALSVTPTDEMKTLTVGEKIYEIVDDQAREDVSEVKADFLQLPTDGVVANSKQLLSENGTDNTEPYLFRATPVNADRAEFDAVVGGTVAWNQLAPTYSYSGSGGHGFYSGATITANHKMLLGFKRDSNAGSSFVGVFCRADGTNQYFALTLPANGALSGATIKVAPLNGVSNGAANNSDGNAWIYQESSATVTDLVLIDLTQAFGSTIADYIYGLETANAGAGVAWFRKYYPADYYPYNAGTLKHVEGLSAHNTVGFNAWDEEWELGEIDGTTGQNHAVSSTIRSKNYIPVLPNTTYYFYVGGTSDPLMIRTRYYDADKNYIGSTDKNGRYNGAGTTRITHDNCHYIRFDTNTIYGTTYKHDICINISDPAKNGTYKPYEKHSYPLDPTVVLRGIPKLSDGKLTYDGDRYLPDGTVERRYGIVDLGTLNWNADSNRTGVFYSSTLQTLAKGNGGIFTAEYVWRNGTIFAPSTISTYNKLISLYPSYGSGYCYIVDHAFDGMSTSEVKTALSGKIAVYELKTPTTETATPYQSLQVCDPNGTEEFVTTGIVPVGHETRYPENLRAKIEGLPWDFSNLIAPTETGTASRNYTVGSLLIMGNVLYKVTANIANGGTITPGTNVTATTLSEVISALQ